MSQAIENIDCFYKSQNTLLCTKEFDPLGFGFEQCSECLRDTIEKRKACPFYVAHDGFQCAEIHTTFGKIVVTFQQIIFRYIDMYFGDLNVKINLKIHYGCYEGRNGFISIEKGETFTIEKVRKLLRTLIKEGFVQKIVENLQYITSVINFVKRENSTQKWNRANDDFVEFHHETDEGMGIYLSDSPVIVKLNKMLESKTKPAD